MCPGPLSWLCPPFPWGHQRSTQGQHCRCSWTVRRGHWGKFPAEFLSPSPGLASGQENPPWRVWQRWLEEPRSSGEVQEQGCTSHISRCPAQVLPGQRDSLITLSFSHEGNVFQGKTQTKKKKKWKPNSQHSKSLENTPASQTPVSWEVLGVLSPQQAQPLLHKPLTAQALLGFSALLGSLPVYSRQQTSSSADWAWGYPPPDLQHSSELAAETYTRVHKACFPLAAETLNVSEIRSISTWWGHGISSTEFLKPADKEVEDIQPEPNSLKLYKGRQIFFISLPGLLGWIKDEETPLPHRIKLIKFHFLMVGTKLIPMWTAGMWKHSVN